MWTCCLASRLVGSMANRRGCNADFNCVQQQIDRDTCAEHGVFCCPRCTNQCPGHPAGEFDQMGQTVYCDGTCVVGWPD